MLDLSKENLCEEQLNSLCTRMPWLSDWNNEL